MSVLFRKASSSISQHRMAKIRSDSRCMWDAERQKLSSITGHKATRFTKSYEKRSVFVVTYSVYWSLPSPVESKKRIRWRQHMSLTLSMPLSLNSYFEPLWKLTSWSWLDLLELCILYPLCRASRTLRMVQKSLLCKGSACKTLCVARSHLCGWVALQAFS